MIFLMEAAADALEQSEAAPAVPTKPKLPAGVARGIGAMLSVVYAGDLLEGDLAHAVSDIRRANRWLRGQPLEDAAAPRESFEERVEKAAVGLWVHSGRMAETWTANEMSIKARDVWRAKAAAALRAAGCGEDGR